MTSEAPPEKVFTQEEYAAFERFDRDALDRVLLALALATEAPAREFSTWRRPLYLPGALGRIDEAAGMLSSLTTNPVCALYQRDEGRSTNGNVTSNLIDMSTLAAGTRRYLLARQNEHEVRQDRRFCDRARAIAGVDGGVNPRKGHYRLDHDPMKTNSGGK